MNSDRELEIKVTQHICTLFLHSTLALQILSRPLLLNFFLPPYSFLILTIGLRDPSLEMIYYQLCLV